MKNGLKKILTSAIVCGALCIPSCENIKDWYNSVNEEQQRKEIAKTRKEEMNQYIEKYWRDRKDIPKYKYLDFWNTKTAKRCVNHFSFNYSFSDCADTARVTAKYDYEKNGLTYFEYEIRDVFVYNDGWRHIKIEYVDLLADNTKSIADFKKGVSKLADEAKKAVNNW